MKTRSLQIAHAVLSALVLACAHGVAHADAELSGIASITVASGTTCALTTAGGVKCWGVSPETGAALLVPTDVAGLESGVTAISGLCALKSDDSVVCRGGLAGFAFAPAVHITAISSAGQHACALTSTGGVKCWGSNSQGQLGNNTNTDSAVPVDVAGLDSGVAAISAGSAHTCALMAATGRVKCWGANSRTHLGNKITVGQLGDGTDIDRWAPTDVVGLPLYAVAIHASAWSTCAVLSGGMVISCWGGGSTAPSDVLGAGPGVAALTGGGGFVPRVGGTAPSTIFFHTCAMTSPGAVKCWGNNDFGQLGEGTTSSRTTPTDVLGLEGVAAIAAGPTHTCALTTTGRVRCWGNNASGQLGDGTKSDQAAPLTPRDVVGLSGGVASISTGTRHSCALATAGGVKCWGGNKIPSTMQTGTVGDGTYIDRPSPVDVQGLSSGVAVVAAGSRHTCAVTSGGAVRCWGANDLKQLGDGSAQFSSPVPTQVTGLASGAIDAAGGGGAHACALVAGGSALCWGLNASGQLGNNATGPGTTPPVSVVGLTGAVAVAAGSEHTCALGGRGGGVSCWGSNVKGQLGDGSATNRHVPTAVPGLGGVVAIAVGGQHTCVVVPGGGVKCWGANDRGQLGDNTQQNRASPVNVTGLASGVVAIAAGTANTCAVTAAGSVKCWGANEFGQLGDGTKIDRLAPVAVVGLVGQVTDVATGGWHTCALASAGTIKCWGLNTQGQLGTGSIEVSGIRAVAAAVVTGLPVSVARSGSGFGNVTSGAAEISCGTTCTAILAPGTSITLTAVADAGSTFTGWSGACTGTGTCSLTVTANASVTANFAANASARLANISTRGRVLTGSDVMIAGFVIGGTAAKTVVVNAVGPSLAAFGIANPLANPVLTLVRSSDNAILASNDNWQDQSNPADVNAIQASGFAPANVLEPAIRATLPPGAYTAILAGAGGGTGVGLVGLFEETRPDAPFVNISTRGQVLTGNDVMIAGFIVQGSGTQNLVVNVAGPSLASFGIANPLANPVLTIVRSSDNAIIATNDNWQTQANPAHVSAIQNAGFQPANTLEPAVFLTLPPGAYTAVVQGVGNTTGAGLVGVFRVP